MTKKQYSLMIDGKWFSTSIDTSKMTKEEYNQFIREVITNGLREMEDRERMIDDREMFRLMDLGDILGRRGYED